MKYQSVGGSSESYQWRATEDNEEGKGGGEGKRRSWKKVGKWVREEEEGEVAKKQQQHAHLAVC